MATVDVLVEGYARPEGDVARVAGTVSLVRSGDVVAVVDPGMVADQALITQALADLDVQPSDVTDVILSHHHPDHTVNVGLFGGARIHDVWAIYTDDVWQNRAAEGHVVADGVTLWETPGHTPQDITTIVETDDGLVALTHLWWFEGIEGDPRATDLDALEAGRQRVLDAGVVRIVPGHGPAFDV